MGFSKMSPFSVPCLIKKIGIHFSVKPKISIVRKLRVPRFGAKMWTWAGGERNVNAIIVLCPLSHTWWIIVKWPLRVRLELKLEIDLFVDNVFPNVAFMTSSTGPCHTGWTATSLILLVASFAGRTSNQRIAITTERSGPSTTCTLQSLSPRIKVRNSLSPPTIANPSVCKK